MSFEPLLLYYNIVDKCFSEQRALGSSQYSLDLSLGVGRYILITYYSYVVLLLSAIRYYR